MRSAAIYMARVVEIGDYETHQGWVKLKLTNGSIFSHAFWAGPAFPQNTYWMPDVGDIVFIFFEGGSWSDPYWFASFYQEGKEPVEIKDGYPRLRAIKTQKGHVLSFDDTDGQEKILVQSAPKDGSYHSFELDTAANTISLTHASGKCKILVTQEGNVEFLAESMSLNVKDVEANTGLVNLKAGEEINITDANGNHIEVDSKGVKVRDKNGNEIRCDGSGVRIKDKDGSKIELRNGKIIIDAQGDIQLNGGNKGVIRTGDSSVAHTHSVVSPPGTAGGPCTVTPATVRFAQGSKSVKAG